MSHEEARAAMNSDLETLSRKWIEDAPAFIRNRIQTDTETRNRWFAMQVHTHYSRLIHGDRRNNLVDILPLVGERAACFERFVEAHGSDGPCVTSECLFHFAAKEGGGLAVGFWCKGNGGNDWVVEAKFTMHDFDSAALPCTPVDYEEDVGPFRG